MDELGRLSVEDFQTKEKKPLVVVLDNVRSMMNVGAVFRSCDAFSVSKLFLCGITASPPHREIEKTALGATISVNWEHHLEIAPVLNQLIADGYTLISFEHTDASVPLKEFHISNEKKYALILGNEVDGVSDAALTLSHHIIEIEQSGTKHSLNISVAAGIGIYVFSS